jgi:hypothetical protein
MKAMSKTNGTVNIEGMFSVCNDQNELGSFLSEQNEQTKHLNIIAHSRGETQYSKLPINKSSVDIIEQVSIQSNDPSASITSSESNTSLTDDPTISQHKHRTISYQQHSNFIDFDKQPMYAPLPQANNSADFNLKPTESSTNNDTDRLRSIATIKSYRTSYYVFCRSSMCEKVKLVFSSMVVFLLILVVFIGVSLSYCVLKVSTFHS